MPKLRLIHDSLAERAAADATRRARDAFERHAKADSPKWYLVHCGGSDIKAIKHLTRPAWQDRFEVYYPQVRVLRPIPKRMITIKQRKGPFIAKRLICEPLWRKYIFIRFDMREDWHDIFEFARIHGFVSNGSSPHAMPAQVHDRIIATVRAMEINGAVPGNTEARKLFCIVGDVVRVIDGAFASHDAIVEGIPDVTVGDLDQDIRIRLALSIFGRSVPALLPLSFIEKR